MPLLLCALHVAYETVLEVCTIMRNFNGCPSNLPQYHIPFFVNSSSVTYLKCRFAVRTQKIIEEEDRSENEVYKDWKRNELLVPKLMKIEAKTNWVS
jgi:hypothetical protein